MILAVLVVVPPLPLDQDKIAVVSRDCYPTTRLLAALWMQATLDTEMITLSWPEYLSTLWEQATCRLIDRFV
jgi:hypothetical protein